MTRTGRGAWPSRLRAGLLAAGLVVAGGLLAGCADGAGGEGAAATATAWPADTLDLAAIPDSAFARLVAELSEPDRYFDTDNLISNESSYLHVMDGLSARGIVGGAYLGVGPGQNFSYMAAIRPALAFLVDIRRDNLLQHLWYKALFERSATRLDFLCLLTARACGGPSDGWTVQALVERVDAAAPVDTVDALVEGVAAAAAATGVPLSLEDRTFIRSIHRRFAEAGLGLRFNTHGRAPRSYYPTLRQLLLEEDRAGQWSSYLATEPGYRWLASFQDRNRAIPVVGDLAGPHALRAIGRELEARGVPVSAFYVSNVEFYLFGDGVYPRFIANLRALPVRDDAVLIRSFFNRFRTLPQTVPGYASTQLLHGIPDLLDQWDEGRVRSYRELVGLSGS